MAYDVVREGGDVILKFNYDNFSLVPSIEDDSKTMLEAIKALSEVKNATKIVFYQKRDYEYDFPQVQLLREVASIYERLSSEKQSLMSSKTLTKNNAYNRDLEGRYLELQNILTNTLRSDPYWSFIKTKRLLRHCHINLQKITDETVRASEESLANVLSHVLETLENTKVIQIAQRYAHEYHGGTRDIYSSIFSPIIRPDFMFTKLMAAFPKHGEIVDSFNVGDTEVTIFNLADQTEYLYHIMP
ncbi:MAG: hypothetical protein ACMXYK_04510, partial [Candidatus Woesearchaeota archaeon]